MRRLNSQATFYNKRLFPAVWFGVAALMAAGAISTAILKRDLSALVMLPLLAIFAGFGYLIMRWLVLDLADEVWDDGDALIVRNRGQDVRVRLAEIMNVGYSGLQNPPRATLYLRQPTAFGREIAFIPPLKVFSLQMFKMPAEIRELMERVDEARRRGGGGGTEENSHLST